jgi:hypothetical protein
VGSLPSKIHQPPVQDDARQVVVAIFSVDIKKPALGGDAYMLHQSIVGKRE